MPAISSQSLGKKSSLTRVIPKSLPNWLAMTIRAVPVMYPVRMGFERKSATNPNLKRPATRQTRPMRMASAAAREAYRAASPPAIGAMTVATRMAVVASGPMTELPRTAEERIGDHGNQGGIQAGHRW